MNLVYFIVPFLPEEVSKLPSTFSVKTFLLVGISLDSPPLKAILAFRETILKKKLKRLSFSV